MECKFKYLQEKLLICHYFSRKSYLHLSEKLDIKHLHNLNFKKSFPKRNFLFLIISNFFFNLIYEGVLYQVFHLN